MFNDTDWLEDDAHLAPFVRLGLGILLERGDWSWWGEPHLVHGALERAIPVHGVATWGGDLAVLDADKWLGPSLAIAIAKAILSIRRRAPLRIKIARAVWHWTDTGILIDEIATDLAQAVGRERIFAEWPRDTRRPFPWLHYNQGQLPVVRSSADFGESNRELMRYSSRLALSSEAPVVDVFVSSSLMDLYRIEAARLVIVFSNDTRDLLGHADELRERFHARCVVQVNADRISGSRWLDDFLAAWSQDGIFVDDAIKHANTASQINAWIVASTQSFVLESAKFLHEGPNIRKYGSLDSDSFSVVRRSPPMDRDIGILKSMSDLTPLPAASPPTVRVLDAQVKVGSQGVDILPARGPISISLDIRLKTPLHGSRPPFPEDKVEWNGDRKALQIHMLEFGVEPVFRSIDVPRHGDSDRVNFPYNVNGNPVDLRFLLSDGPRILQTARLRAEPGTKIQFYIESIATPVQLEKRPFDVALLVNDSLGGQPSITTLTTESIQLSPLSDVDAENSRNGLLTILERLVTNPDTPIAPTLLELANHGHMLLKHLKENVESWPDRIERVQLMTQSNAFFPLEYLYDGNVPESTNADLCPKRHTCLRNGEAISPCDIREAAKHLCPMGFLGISATIERHTWQMGKPAGIWIELPQDLAERYHIKDLKKAVFSAADRANDFFDNELPMGVKPVRINDIAKELGADCLPNWTEWKTQVDAIRPSLLVLLVHIDDGKLFIGDEVEGLNLAGLSKRHIGDGQPVAIAIGCGSGVGKIPGSNLPAAMMRNGARVVIAALTDVLGRHANRAALDLIERFRKATASHEPIAVGELMTELRREFLGQDIALGLVLVAFGDADIALGGQ